MSAGFRFDAPRNLAVFVCEHVGRHGSPILQVAHDAEGDWQFLCGSDHSDDDKPMLVGLGHMVDQDPSVNEVAEMGCHHTASRSSVGAAWRIVDDLEADVLRNIREHGCHVMLIAPDDEGSGFAYSIGLDPELIVVGLPIELMHSMVNALGSRMRDGERAEPGQPVYGLLEAATCTVLEMERRRYKEYLGYALWYHRGPDFRTLQIVWPSKVSGRFPWEPGGEGIRDRQPLLGPYSPMS